MIPIAKNINVIDDQGNHYEATYAKRARGLVKNGRAYFIDDNKICLVSLPNQNLEDKIMSENVYNEFNNEEVTKVVEANVPPVAPELPKMSEASTDVTLTGIFEQITKIISNTDHLNEAVQNIADMSDDHGAGMKAEAIGSLIHAREATNRQALQLLEKMYDHLNPKPAISSEEMKLDTIKELIRHGYDAPELMKDILGSL